MKCFSLKDIGETINDDFLRFKAMSPDVFSNKDRKIGVGFDNFFLEFLLTFVEEKIYKSSQCVI